MSNKNMSVSEMAGKIALSITGLVLALGVLMGAIWGFNSFGRSQDIADAKNKAQANLITANNNVQVTEIEIQNQQQKIQVTQQQAQIRFEEAKGVKAAQDEISKTLTPLYVQMEYAKALEQIAESGKNNSVIYIPTGPGGVPIVTNPNANQVGGDK